jgi:hypothetical protein
MNGMVHGESIRHEASLAMDVLIIGLTRLDNTDENHQERVIMRATLTQLEMTWRYINSQIKKAKGQQHE